jgi:hypothetical protein
MMMVAVIALAQELETGSPFAQVEAFHNAHALKQMKGAIDGRQVTVPRRKSVMDFFDGQWPPLLSQNAQNGLSRNGHLARFAPELFGQVRQVG